MGVITMLNCGLADLVGFSLSRPSCPSDLKQFQHTSQGIDLTRILRE